MKVDFKCTMVSQFSHWLHNCLPIKGKRRSQEEGDKQQNYQNELFDFLMKQKMNDPGL